MYYFITINIVVQLPGVPEVNSTHSDDSNRQHIAPPQIVVGETFDDFKRFEDSNHHFTDENDDCDESSLLFDTAIQESSPKAVEITTPIIEMVTGLRYCNTEKERNLEVVWILKNKDNSINTYLQFALKYLRDAVGFSPNRLVK